MSAIWTPAGGIDGLPLQGQQRVDIYMVWDRLTHQARHHSATEQRTHWPVMVELARQEGSKWRATLAAWCGLPEVQAHGQQLEEAFAPSLALAPDSAIHTALLPRTLEAVLLAGVAGGALERFQLGAPCAYQPPASVAEAAGNRLGSSTSSHVLGIIDDGCCFAHQDFRSGPSGNCRVHALWDQSPAARADQTWSTPRPLQGSAPYRYGVELLQSDLQAALAGHPQLGEAAERVLYDTIGRPQWGRPTHTHGARVMHLLAGPAATAAARPAQEMPIVFVQLPAQTVGDVTGDSLGMHVLDGVRYIVDHAKALGGKGWSATINISLGSIAGPHDGTSMAEQALAELTRDEPRVRLVMAAGNTAGERERIHAQQVVGGGRGGRFVLRVPPANARDGFAEFWFDGMGAPADGFAITVTSPTGQTSDPVRVGQAMVLGAAGADPQAAIVFARSVAQGDDDPMALLAIAPTAAAGRPAAAPGFWTVDILSGSKADTDVHAWIERDDAVVGVRRVQQLHFENPTGSVADRSVNDDVTLSNLANAPGLVTAGGYVAASGRVADYSANGPRRGKKNRPTTTTEPDHFAPSDRSQWLAGLVVPGFFSGTLSTINGTSAAAPQIARALAEQRLIDARPDRLRPPLPRRGKPARELPPGTRSVDPPQRRQAQAPEAATEAPPRNGRS